MAELPLRATVIGVGCFDFFFVYTNNNIISLNSNRLHLLI
jgi:hypothetical protein